jgi:hypothetical protein
MAGPAATWTNFINFIKSSIDGKNFKRNEKASQKRFLTAAAKAAAGRTEVVKMLIETNAAVNAPTMNITPIMVASKNGKTEAVKLLEAKGGKNRLGDVRKVLLGFKNILRDHGTMTFTTLLG